VKWEKHIYRCGAENIPVISSCAFLEFLSEAASNSHKRVRIQFPQVMFSHGGNVMIINLFTLLIADICYIAGRNPNKIGGVFSATYCIHYRVYVDQTACSGRCVRPRVLSTSVVNSWSHSVLDSF